MNKKDLKKVKGFTLTELIIVIVIIGILAAVLIPSLTKYIDRARDAAAKQEAAPYITALSTYNIEYTGNSNIGSFEDYCQELGFDVSVLISFEESVDSSNQQVVMYIGATNTGYHTQGFILFAKNDRLIVYDYAKGSSDIVKLKDSDIEYDGFNGETVSLNNKEGFLGLKEVINKAREQKQPIKLDLSGLLSGNGKITSNLVVQEDGFVVFPVDNQEGNCKIIGYLGDEKNVTIPKVYFNEKDNKVYNVTEISNDAFARNVTLESITIHKDIVSIGKSAFEEAANLTTVVFEDGSQLTTIGEATFRACEELINISIPSNVTSIGSFGFERVEKLATVNLPEGLTEIKEATFRACRALASITIPAKVTTIGVSAFEGASTLASVEFRKGSDDKYVLNAIGDKAFEGCVALTEMNFPESLTEIGKQSFKDCDSLTTIALGSSLSKVGEFAFNECSKLESVTYNITNESADLGKGIFSQCFELTTVTINDAVKKIPNLIFSECSKITTITLPNGLTTLDCRSFYRCTSLTSVTIPSTITTWGSKVFEDCTALVAINLPDTLTSLGDYMFLGCVSLTTVNIPTSVNVIPTGLFENCVALNNINLHDQLTTIGNSAFKGCVALSKISFPSSLTTIESNAFSDCVKLGSVYIPQTVTTMGEKVFAGCTNLGDTEKAIYIEAEEEKINWDSNWLYNYATKWYGSEIVTDNDGIFKYIVSCTSVRPSAQHGQAPGNLADKYRLVGWSNNQNQIDFSDPLPTEIPMPVDGTRTKFYAVYVNDDPICLNKDGGETTNKKYLVSLKLYMGNPLTSMNYNEVSYSDSTNEEQTINTYSVKYYDSNGSEMDSTSTQCNYVKFKNETNELIIEAGLNHNIEIYIEVTTNINGTKLTVVYKLSITESIGEVLLEKQESVPPIPETIDEQID